MGGVQIKKAETGKVMEIEQLGHGTAMVLHF